MNILITENQFQPKSCWIRSKSIICPKCGECAKLDIKNYKVVFTCTKGCKNVENISLNEYEKTQKIDISKIICDECKINNKANSYNNIFYICNQCKKNMCIQCQNKHKQNYKEHNSINYDDKNYICGIHNENYVSYCEQ